MTSTHRPPLTSPHPASSARSQTPSTCEHRLRVVLRANALTSSISGVVLAIAPDRIDDLLDTGRPGWVRVVGLALLPFAAFVAWLSTASRRTLQALTPSIVVGDVGWVIGSLVTIMLGWYSGGGVITVVAMAAMVDVFAFLQWRAWRRLTR